MAFRSIAQIAGSALTAQSVRLNTIASNLANANTAAGSEAEVYRARKPVFAAVAERNGLSGGQVAGMVFYPNVNPVAEMTDMMAASRAFETNVEVMSRIKSMQQSLLRMGEE
jgi:flagellar basal-body rod protein FlgC